MHSLNMITVTFIYPKICCMSNRDIQEPCQCDVLYEITYLWITNTEDTFNSEQNMLNAAVYITNWTLNGSLMHKDSS